MAQSQQLWHTMPTRALLKELATKEEGLSQEEVKKRLSRHGHNILASRKRVPLLRIFLRQFLSPFVYLLVIAAGIAGFIGDITDVCIILGAVVITVGFGFFQEAKAEKTMEALEKLVKKRVRVIRAGRNIEIDASLLVPGDIMFIGEGDRISADARLIESRNLEVEEAALTGESIAVKKDIKIVPRGALVPDRTNMVFTGTVASKGRGKAVVVAIGMKTELGKIAQSVHALGEGKTPLQKNIGRVARLITVAVFVILGILIIAGILRDLPLEELLITSIAVAVAAIPESLVVAVTIILAIGTVRLLKGRALIRRLVSAETLGNTTVICVDKTGTLTEGDMYVTRVVTETDNAKSREFALRIGMTTNEAYFDVNSHPDIVSADIKGDPTERAILRAGLEADLGEEYIIREEKILDELPFASENQFMATLVKESGDSNRLYVKGSPEKILEFSKERWAWDEKEEKEKVRTFYAPQKEEGIMQVNELSKRGFRLLAVGYRDVPDTIKMDKTQVKLEKVSQLGENPIENIVFVGFIAFSDPLRPKTRETVSIAKKAGIRIVVITGDHRLTAKTIAEDLGLKIPEDAILEGKDLAKMSEDDLKKTVQRIIVYARIVPHDKLRIVEALQAHGEVVAMTGDGVNDAPALKKADIGVAMGSGQDVAKEASDMIILDDNFRSIVRAVREGRVILDNIRKVVLYLLSDSFSEIMLMGTALILGWPIPLLAGQILWINIIEDALPAFALSYEPPEKDVMKLKPEGKKSKVLTGEIKTIILAVGLISDFLLLGVFAWFYLNSYDISYVRTMVFAGLAINSLFMIFSLKSLRHSILSINPFSNMYLVGSVIFGLAMLVSAIYVPFLQGILKLVSLEPIHWIIIIGLGISEIFLIEITKWMFTHKRGRVIHRA